MTTQFANGILQGLADSERKESKNNQIGPTSVLDQAIFQAFQVCSLSNLHITASVKIDYLSTLTELNYHSRKSVRANFLTILI